MKKMDAGENFERIKFIHRYKEPQLRKLSERAWAQSTTWFAGQQVQSFKLLTTDVYQRNPERMKRWAQIVIDDVKIVRIWRANEKEQAYSWGYAMATGMWTSNHRYRPPADGDILYNFTKCVNEWKGIVKAADDAFWAMFTPNLSISYDELCANPAPALARIATAIGVRRLPEKPSWVTETRLRVQRNDAEYRTLVAAYEAQREAAGEA